MSPRFVLGRENVPCVAEVVSRSFKADSTDFTNIRSEYATDFCHDRKSAFKHCFNKVNASEPVPFCPDRQQQFYFYQLPQVSIQFNHVLQI